MTGKTVWEERRGMCIGMPAFSRAKHIWNAQVRMSHASSSDSVPPGCVDPRLLRLVRGILLGLPIAWLWLAAIWIKVEYYDGYDAISNARFLTGEFPAFILTRAPLMPALLAPVRLLTRGLGLHPLEVRPYHVVSAALHTAYLLGIYSFLRRRHGESMAVLAVFATSILNFVFFSYAPFISHDLLPGGLFLLMLVLADRVGRPGGRRAWGALVLTGAAAALIKPTYGLFWVCVLLSEGLPYLLSRGQSDRRGLRVGAAMLGGAALSGILYWLIMAMVLGRNFPGRPPFLLRPYLQIQQVMTQYEGTPVRFPVWVYVRNLPFYGLLNLVLLVPGLVLCLRRDRFSRSVAVSWIAAFAAMHVLAFREVRYLAFLTPLSAYIGCRSAPLLFKSRFNAALLALLAVDLVLAGGEALRLRAPFYRDGPQRAFCDAVRPGDRLRSPVFYTGLMSFIPPLNSPFAGDRYHRMFHIGPRHLQMLYGVPRRDLRRTPLPEQALRTAAGEFPQACLFSARRELRNSLEWLPGPPSGLTGFAMAAAVSTKIADSATGGGVWSAAADGDAPGPAVPQLRGPDFARLLEPCLLPCLLDRTSGAVFPAELSPAGTLRVLANEDGVSPSPTEDWEVRAFRLQSLAVPSREGPGLAYIEVP